MNEVAMNEPVKQVQAQKVSIRARLARLKQSPWMLATVPLLLIAMTGGVWLGNHMQVITDNINQPYALLFWPMFFACIVAVYLLFVFFKAIVAGLKALGKAILAWLRRPGAAFWIGTGIFMIVSIAEGSGVFNEIFQDNFNGMLGFAAAISIDAISVTCILARQDASRRNNAFGKHFFMAGIIACALISTMANGYITKEHYSAPTNIAGTIWEYCAYAIGLIPPIYIVFLGFASDFISDQKSDIFLDPVAYENSQKDRLKFLQVQLDAERETKRIKDELAQLRGKKAKEKRAIVYKIPAWSFLGFTVYQKQNVPAMTEIAKEIEALRSEIASQPKGTINAHLVSSPVSKFAPIEETPNETLCETAYEPDDETIASVSSETDQETIDETENLFPVSRSSRITVKLHETQLETGMKQERNTDELNALSKRSASVSRNRNTKETDAIIKMRRIIKRNPDIDPMELAKKADVTPQYARKVKNKVLSEKTA